MSVCQSVTSFIFMYILLWRGLQRLFASPAEYTVSIGTLSILRYRYQIDGYPTLYLFKNGRPVEEYNGNRTVRDITSYVEAKSAPPPPPPA